MLSSRGAVTTNVALVECAAGQNASDKSVFLLSELEKVWVAVAVVARRLLLDGAAVQISPFGALWTKEYVLLRDRQQLPYTTRKLCFGININYANRYGIDKSKVPLERPGGEGYVRVSMADIVAVCGVPARTAAAALKEFFLYLGEGLSRGRVFQLSIPGVATIAMKRQKAVLSMNEELRRELYEIDSRKWPVDVQREGYEVLQAQGTAASSIASSRPSTARLSLASWRAAPAGAAEAGDGADPKKPVFVAAAPSGRLFDDIAQQAEQRRRLAQSAVEAQREQHRRQADLDRRIAHYGAYDFGHHADAVAEAEGLYGAGGFTDYGEEEGDDAYEPYPHPVVGGVDGGHARTVRPPTASGESVYDLVPHGAPTPATSYQYHGRHGSAAVASTRQNRRQQGAAGEEEPDVEVIEIVDDTHDGGAVPSRENQPGVNKNAELERILREEETFSRPISRQTYHESSAARDLIYSQPYEAPSRPSRARVGAAPAGSSSAAPVQREPASPHVNVSAPSLASAKAGQTQDDVFRFGRRRFVENPFDDDHVGTLLQYREYGQDTEAGRTR